MMKQKMVLKLQMGDPKSRSKAMRVVVSVAGVLSASIEGEGKDKIVVVGEGVDSIYLTTLLRKSVGFAELVSVTPIDQKKKQEDGSKPYKESSEKQTIWADQPTVPQYVYPVYERQPDPCSIM